MPKNSTKPTLRQAYTLAQAREAMDDTGRLTEVLAFDLYDLIEGDIEWLNDAASERITGCSTALEDITYKVAGTAGGAVLIEVRGAIENYLLDHDEKGN